MLSRELEVTLNLAFKDARAKRHELMSVEHLLLSLLDNTAAINVLRSCGADIEILRKELEDFLEATTPLIPKNESDRETQPTLGFQRVLQRAVFHVQSSGRKEVTGASVLVAIFTEQESHAVYLLKQQEINRIDVVNFIAHGTRKDGHEEEPEAADNIEEVGGDDEKSPTALEAYSTNLNEQARKGLIDPLAGREDEIE